MDSMRIVLGPLLFLAAMMHSNMNDNIDLQMATLFHNKLFKEAFTNASVTASATARFAEYFRDKEIIPIRIFYNAGG